jgi:DNA-directed RNA polymerase specialized sigma24 family protein
MTQARPTDEELFALHARLVAGDPTASSALAEALFADLISRLERFSGATPEEASDAVTLALVNYFKSPSGYDHTKCKLRTFLRNAALRDCLNEREKAKRVASHEKSVGLVEDYEVGRNRIMRGGGRHDSDRPDWLLEVKEAWQILEQEFPDPQDQEMIQMMLAGERSSGAYAEVLGLSSAPIARRREVVKQHKDRIQKKLQRLREKYSDES